MKYILMVFLITSSLFALEKELDNGKVIQYELKGDRNFHWVSSKNKLFLDDNNNFYFININGNKISKGEIVKDDNFDNYNIDFEKVEKILNKINRFHNSRMNQYLN